MLKRSLAGERRRELQTGSRGTSVHELPHSDRVLPQASVSGRRIQSVPTNNPRLTFRHGGNGMNMKWAKQC